jgi:hypothetical protein
MEKDSALFPSIPASTVRAARALYGPGNLYLRLGDRLNHLASKFDQKGLLAHLVGNKTALLTVLTIIQYVEKLTDAELADSIHMRVDLRYALHLNTPSPRIDPHSLCAFRSRIMTHPQCHILYEEVFKTIYPEITSTAMQEEPHIDDVLNSICENEVRALLMEAMLGSMEALSANHFNWLRGIALPHWYQRYNRSLVASSLDGSIRKQEVSREDIQRDIQHLLYEIRVSDSRDIMEMRETQKLHLIWEQLTDPNALRNCHQCTLTIH